MSIDRSSEQPQIPEQEKGYDQLYEDANSLDIVRRAIAIKNSAKKPKLEYQKQPFWVKVANKLGYDSYTDPPSIVSLHRITHDHELTNKLLRLNACRTLGDVLVLGSGLEDASGASEEHFAVQTEGGMEYNVHGAMNLERRNGLELTVRRFAVMTSVSPLAESPIYDVVTSKYRSEVCLRTSEGPQPVATQDIAHMAGDILEGLDR